LGSGHTTYKLGPKDRMPAFNGARTTTDPWAWNVNNGAYNKRCQPLVSGRFALLSDRPACGTSNMKLVAPSDRVDVQ